MDERNWMVGYREDMPQELTPEDISHNGRDVFITRIKLPTGEIQPAKLVDGTAFFTSNGKEHLLHMDDKYPILRKDKSMRWIRVQDRQIPNSAIQVGNTADGEPLFATRVRYPYVPDIAIGKVKAGEDSVFPYLGKERTAPDFDVLVHQEPCK